MDRVRLAIHEVSGGLSDRWIEYCKGQGVEFKIVDCLGTDIIREISDCDGLIWRLQNIVPATRLMAKSLTHAVEAMGRAVYPNSATLWHYDDKIAQKYLFEAIGAPMIQTSIFFDRREALEWVERAEFPKVFKLRCGAGSNNVMVARDRQEARRLVEKAFGGGFQATGRYLWDLRIKARKTRGLDRWREKLKRLPATLGTIANMRHMVPRERGYAYFQDFLPDNAFDTRITVIGDRAFGFTRDVRPGDFRASGSGLISYDAGRIDPRCVRIAFDVARRLGSQSLAFDFLFAPGGEPVIGEISFAFLTLAVYRCPGHWDREMKWQEGHVWPEHAIIVDLLNSIRQGRTGTGESPYPLPTDIVPEA